MIWIRRTLAALMVPVFAFALLLTLFVFAVNATLLDPRFYTDTLRRLDVFDDFYDEVLPILIQRELDIPEVPLKLDLSPQGLSAKAKRVLTPEWLETNSGEAIHELLPYLTGDENSFRVSIELASRAEAAARLLPELIREAELYDYVLDEGLRHAIEARRQSFESLLPFGARLTTDDVMAGLRMLVSEDWLLEQVRAALGEIVPYLTGETESFRVVLSLSDRSAEVQEVLRHWFSTTLKGRAGEYLLEEHILPVVSARLESETSVAWGAALSKGEVLDAFGSSRLPRKWVEGRVEEAVADMGPYLMGKTDAFTFTIPMEDVVSGAADSLVEVADARGRAMYDALPLCAPNQSRPSSSSEVPPPCRPPEVSYERYKVLAGLDTRASLEEAISRQLPARIALTQTDLFTAPPGTDAASALENVRRHLREHYTFDRLELRRLLEERDDRSSEDVRPAWERFQAVRARLRDGFTITHTDLRERLDERGAFERFDQTRRSVGKLRNRLFLLIVGLMLVAALIGFLGGRRRGTRLIWVAVALFAGALLVVAFAGLADEPLRSFGADVIRGLDTARSFTPTLLEVRDALIAGLLGRLRAQGVVVAIVALALLIGGVVVGRRQRRVHQE